MAHTYGQGEMTLLVFRFVLICISSIDIAAEITQNRSLPSTTYHPAQNDTSNQLYRRTRVTHTRHFTSLLSACNSCQFQLLLSYPLCQRPRRRLLKLQ